MTIRTFWTIFIKILGIWLILESLTVIPQGLSAVLAIFSAPYSNEPDLIILAIVVLTFAIYLLVMRLLLLRTEWLINKLHLDRGFQEERIELNLSLSMGITIASFIIGGLILIDSIPDLCRELFNFYQQKSLFRESPSAGWIFFYIVKSVIGYFLITNCKIVAAFIVKKTLNSGNEEV